MHMLVFKMLVVNLLLGNRLNAFSILSDFVINPLQSKCYFHSAVLKTVGWTSVLTLGRANPEQLGMFAQMFTTNSRASILIVSVASKAV